MQTLPVNVLQTVANRLPVRNARRFGQTMSAARVAVGRSLAARAALDMKKDRATSVLAGRNRDIMAVVTRMVRFLETTGAQGRRLEDAPVVQYKGIEGRVWHHLGTPRLSLKMRVPSGRSARATEITVAYKVHANRHAILDHLYMGGRQSIAERRVALRGISRAFGEALKANGYTVAIDPQDAAWMRR